MVIEYLYVSAHPRRWAAAVWKMAMKGYIQRNIVKNLNSKFDLEGVRVFVRTEADRWLPHRRIWTMPGV